MTCRVQGCRFRDSHVTSGHLCGRCGQFGHGQLECGNSSRIDRLRIRTEHDRVAVECTIFGCLEPHTHTTPAHHCTQCGVRGVSCRHMHLQVACPMCRVPNSVDVTNTIFGNSECVVCMEQKPAVIFPICRHATTCADCVIQMHQQ